MMENNYGPKQDKFKDPFDGEYVGNIWGWKFSFISLALILFLLALMAYRHYTLGISPLDLPPENTEIKTDTLTN